MPPSGQRMVGVYALMNFVDRTFDLKARLDASIRWEMDGVCQDEKTRQR